MTRDRGELPTRDQILDFLASRDDTVGKREIAKAFGVQGDRRVLLKALLAEMVEEGLISGGKRDLRQAGAPGNVAVLEIVDQDGDGELIAEPIQWDTRDGPRPRVWISAHPGEELTPPGHARTGKRSDAASTVQTIGMGDRVLARISRNADAHSAPGGAAFVGRPIKRLPREKDRLVGIYRRTNSGGGLVASVDRKSQTEWVVPRDAAGDAKDGDLVRFDLVRKGRFHTPQARIVEVLGNPADQRQISLIAVHAHAIPDAFPESVLDELATLPPLDERGRVDLTDLALVTIDPEDARDHDDAVHAKRDDDPSNPGGFIVTVAIADVSHYVRPGTRLDREARRRGNSCYFPDRVVPMLPERISNDLCSLIEAETRPTLAVRMTFDAQGHKRRHAFVRGLMRSAAKLTYAQAQAAFEGRLDAKTAPIAETVLVPLLAAYRCLAAQRDRRGPLDLDLPERRIRLDDTGRVRDVVVPERLEAHRLIEEFMIQANVAAAEALEERRAALVYRVHDQPSPEKLQGLREFLETLNLSLPQANILRPQHINGVLARARELPVPQLVSEVVLRAQSQAVYDVSNIGHFGLNLKRYAHFTSPIRRYADLLVHRALIAALRLGPDGEVSADVQSLRETAEHISMTERRAMAAERETVDRLIASFLAERVGATFSARVSGVIKSGVFVRLTETGADGFIPASTLAPGEYFEHIEASHAMVSRETGRGYRLGDPVDVRLAEAIPMLGMLRFEMLSEGVKLPLVLQKGYRGQTRFGRGQRGVGHGGTSRPRGPRR
ncbi:MAG: ribonuclease R [Hyphomicrobiaceae bacterium]